MTTIYWFALIVGGGLLAASLVGSLADAGHDHGGGEHDVSQILSLRNLTYFLFAFGAIGVVMSGLGGIPGVVVGGVAVAVGLVAAAAASSVLGLVRRTEAGEREGEASFIGCAGRVTLPLATDRAGRVVVRRGTREYELRALPFDPQSHDAPIGAGVVVVEMEAGTALVTRMDEPLLVPGATD